AGKRVAAAGSRVTDPVDPDSRAGAAPDDEDRDLAGCVAPEVAGTLGRRRGRPRDAGRLQRRQCQSDEHPQEEAVPSHGRDGAPGHSCDGHAALIRAIGFARAGCYNPSMEIRLLGPLEVRDGDGVVSLPRRQQRALLAALAMRAGEVVSIDRLVADLWGESAPASATGSLQNTVWALRKLIGRD